MKLQQAFNIQKGDVVAFVGAGGKTSTLVGLAYELMEQGWRVLATSTRAIGVDQLELFPRQLRADSSSASISAALNEARLVFLYDHLELGRAFGLSNAAVMQLLDRADSDVMLIEADDAAGLGWKAPRPDEPSIPPATTVLITLASLGVIDKPLNETWVYHPEAIMEKYGFVRDTPIRAPWIAQTLRDEELGLKGLPAQARALAFLNVTPLTGYTRTRARLIARLVLRGGRIEGVAIGSVRSADRVYEMHRRTAALVLAAGLSSRMGDHKMLLPWADGKPIIVHIVEQLQKSRLDQVVVVTGHRAEDVRRALKGYDVTFVNNRQYRTGEMLSSLQAGLRVLDESVGAALICLGDQPRIETKTIYKVLKAYYEGAGAIIAPSYQMRRGHPILISRSYWAEILALGKTGALRDVMKAHAEAIHHVVVQTDSVLHDVDTPQEYRDERRRAGLD